ncbi:hypothetical protein LO749_18830 [Paracoccus denitrificans]|uniref:hypothetical protein n=1 Tax=Paracoccus denitrificans TaxID=266 RepID=UPI001E39A6B2|nr:hypothetical protein [Paracoccus denitrificans]UFS66561.1 hypothetical protein LO749_18830 [Paracoccus denitrificans]
MSRVIDVDAEGRPIDGSPLMEATDWAVSEGLMVNAPVTLRFPNGMIVHAVEGVLTKKGFDALAAEMGADQPRH